MGLPSFISAYPIADTLPDGYLFIPKEECLFSRQHFSWIGQMPGVGHPDFKEMLGIVPSEVGREIDLSFDIAARIHEVLVRKGWSQADFARNAGKKEAEISKWMSGQHNFTIRTIAFIENALGEEILSVKRYRTHKAAATAAKQYNRSPYGAGLLNDSGGEGYSSKQKK